MPTLFASRARPAAPWRTRLAGGYGVSAEPNWRGVDWRAHLHQVEIDGRSVNYVDIGAGEKEPVVFVHGISGQWQNWLENIPRAAKERRVVALDLPGFGCSEMPRERISMQGYGRCVDALCEALGLGHVAIVGNSLGGFIASEVAIQFPERVERLVLVSAAGMGTANVYRASALAAGRFAAALATNKLADHRRIASRPITRHVVLALVARYPALLKPDLVYEGLLLGAGKPGFQTALRALFEYDFRHRLPEIGCPTLIVWGRNDSILSVRDAQEFERLIPGSRKLVMEETGHVPQVERPRAFNEALLEFLGEVRHASAPSAGETEASGPSEETQAA